MGEKPAVKGFGGLGWNLPGLQIGLSLGCSRSWFRLGSDWEMAGLRVGLRLRVCSGLVSGEFLRACSGMARGWLSFVQYCSVLAHLQPGPIRQILHESKRNKHMPTPHSPNHNHRECQNHPKCSNCYRSRNPRVCQPSRFELHFPDF